MTKLEIAAVYVGLNLLLLAALGLRVANYRRLNRIGIGDGGDAHLFRLVRIHGNAAEYIPVGLIGILFLALLDPAPAWLVHGAGMSLTGGRVLHAFGLAQSEGASFGRVAGMILTLAAIALCGLGAIWAAFSPIL